MRMAQPFGPESKRSPFNPRRQLDPFWPFSPFLPSNPGNPCIPGCPGGPSFRVGFWIHLSKKQRIEIYIELYYKNEIKFHL